LGLTFWAEWSVSGFLIGLLFEKILRLAGQAPPPHNKLSDGCAGFVLGCGLVIRLSTS